MFWSSRIADLIQGESPSAPPGPPGSAVGANASEGCVAGIMRKHVLSIAHQHKILYFENQVTLNTIMNGDEMFLTNCIKGVQWVGQFKHKYYTNKTAQLFTEKLNALTMSDATV